MVLKTKLHAKRPKRPPIHNRSSINPRTRMPARFRLDDTHGRDEPFAKVEPRMKDCVGEQGHDVGVADFLFPVCECGEERRRVFGHVVRSVVFPEEGDLVHAV